MTWIVSASSTVSLSVGTALTLTSDITNATYVFMTNAVQLQNGETLKLQVQSKVLATDTAMTVWQATVGNSGGGITSVIQSPFLPSDQYAGFIATLTSASANRTITWKVLRQ